MKLTPWLAPLLLALCAACGDREVPGLPEVAFEDLERPLGELLRERSRAVQDDPESAEAWGTLALAFDAHAFPDEALQCYERARDLNRGDFRWPYLAGALISVSDQAGALAHFERAANLRDDYAPLYVRSGQGRFLTGDLVRARSDFERALELDAGLITARLGLARVELAEDRPAQALEQLEAAQRAQPVTDEIHGLLAEVHRRLGDDALAAEAAARVLDSGRREPLPDPLRGAVEEQGVSLTWIRRRADRALQLGVPERAVQLWQGAVDADDQDPEARLGLASVLRSLGRGPESEWHLVRAQKLLAGAHDERGLEMRTTVALHLGGLALEGEDLDEAERQFRLALELADDALLAGARANLGAVCVRKGQISEALVLLRLAAPALPNDPGVRVNLGNALADGAHWAEACEALDEALAIDPDLSFARFQRGRVRVKMLDFAGAAEDFARVTELQPTNAGAFRNLARARARGGDHLAGIAALRDGLEQLPLDTRLRQQLAWVLATSPDARARDGSESLRLARELLAADADNPELLEVLAAACAETGDLASAEKHEGAAILALEGLAEVANRDDVRAKMLERLETYRSGEAWRE